MWTAAYIAAIVAANVGFAHIPLVDVGGIMFPPMSLLVGGVFVLRDLAQREAGHGVLLAMAAGVALSYVMADPFVAFASAAAFAASEVIDWSIYTASRAPLRRRILWSSAASTPIDSAVFLALIGAFSLPAAALMTASKMTGALVVWAAMRGRR